jgi:hypothetical protein
MTKFATYIKQETLSRELTENVPPDGAYVEEYEIEGNTLTLAVKR